ncbi:3-oxoacyl-ACP synthase III family protein [Amycolatopsis sp. NPDC059021]|uniref:3-oxoacyl-ACP synthase III family protein n=1 Tax=Amycolatopsis sp. NPDC059021 TaxID=3346704 RepID=UPI00367181E4
MENAIAFGSGPDGVAGHGGGAPRIPVGILGVGVSIPDRVVTNDELVRGLDTSDEWIRSHTGIRERRFAAAGRTTSDLCADAARAALRRAGVDPGSLDAIVISTITPDQPLPSTALAVKERLGARHAIPVDLTQYACAGGIYGIMLGCQLLQSDDVRHVLVIGAELLSRLTDPGDRGTRVFFGDAAGAVVLGRTEPGYGILAWDLGSELSYAVEVPAGGASLPPTEETARRGDHHLKMDGRSVWKVATAVVPGSIRKVVERAGAKIRDIRHFYLHQANLNIINEVLEQLGASSAVAPITIDRLGNTGGASVFTAMAEGMNTAAPRRGDLMVVSGIGAGFLWGSLCLRQQ